MSQTLLQCLVHTGRRAMSRLDELGLSSHVLCDSIQRADFEASRVSSRLYPRNYPGIVMWAEATAQLRRSLVGKGTTWRIGRSYNYETVYSTDFDIAIAVVGGDRNTGLLADKHPSLSRRRGPKTTERVQRNFTLDQLELDLDVGVHIPAQRRPDENCRTWFMVCCPDRDEMRLELSLPVTVQVDGTAVQWRERILLPTVPLNSSREEDVNDPLDDEDVDDLPDEGTGVVDL